MIVDDDFYMSIQVQNVVKYSTSSHADGIMYSDHIQGSQFCCFCSL